MNDTEGTPTPDGLTRTQLHIHDATPASIRHVLRALQRVPGVLLAENRKTTSYAIVAHDSAVAEQSLIAAAAVAGSRATVVKLRTQPPSIDAVAPAVSADHMTRLVIAAAVALAGLALVEFIIPSGYGRALTGGVAVLWAIFFIHSLVTQRSGK